MVGSAGGWHLDPLHLGVVRSDSPYHARGPHRLNHCMLQEQLCLGHSAAPPHPGSSACRAGAAWVRPCFIGHGRNLPGALLGTILVLKHNQPQALAKLSASHSEGEQVHHTPRQDYPAWPGLPARGFPSSCRAKPSEHVQLQVLVEACSFSSAPVHCFARSPYRGDISSIPWCLFSSACAGNGANYCVTSCSLKGIHNEADRIGLNTK